MVRELIIILLIFWIVISLDVITNHYLKENVVMLSNELDNLKGYVVNQKQEEAILKTQSIKEKWGKVYRILAYYIEHNELEKVSTEIIKLGAHIDMKDYKESISQIDTTKYILEHIGEKEQLDWISIF